MLPEATFSWICFHGTLETAALAPPVARQTLLFSLQCDGSPCRCQQFFLHLCIVLHRTQVLTWLVVRPAGDSDTLCDMDGSQLLLEKSKVGRCFSIVPKRVLTV